MVAKTKMMRLHDGSPYQLRGRGKTEAEAKLDLEKKIWQFENGLIVVTAKTTFERWGEEYCEKYLRPGSETTHRGSKSILKNYFYPEIGSIPMCDLLPIHIQGCANKFIGMSKSQIDKGRQTINGMLRQAKANKLMTEDISLYIIWPTGHEEGGRALSPAERKIAEKIISIHPRGNLFGLIYYAGLRPGEARAYLHTKTNFKEHYVRVDQAVKKATQKIDIPKSKAGIRNVPACDELLELLRKSPKTGLFVASNSTGGFLSEKAYARAWQSFKRLMYIEAGVPTYRNKIIEEIAEQTSIYTLTPYCFRHNYITMLAEAQVDMNVAQKWAGHSNWILTKKIYTHVTESLVGTSWDKALNMFKPQEPNGTNMGQKTVFI